MYRNPSSELSDIWDEAKTHVEQGDYAKAIEIYKYILIRYPEEKVAVEYASAYLGDIYLTLDKLELAERYIKKAIECNPQKPDYRYQLGFVYSKLKRWKRAVLEFKVAVTAEPGSGEYLRGLGWAIYNGSDKARGLHYLRKANQLQPKNINILNDLSVAYLGIPDLKNAKKFNEQALELEPANSLAMTIGEQIKYLEKHWPQDFNRE